VSVFTKPNPVGVDIKIQNFQTLLYSTLVKKWNLDPVTDWDCYGRAYRNQNDNTGGYVPEAFVGDTTIDSEYQELFFDDTKAAVSFFGVGETSTYGGAHGAGTATTPVFWVMSCDVTRLKPLIIGYRADEEIRNDAQRACQAPMWGMMMTGWVTGIDNVFKEYPGFRKKDGLPYRDMQKFHCFRINFDLTYNIRDCNTLLKSF